VFGGKPPAERNDVFPVSNEIADQFPENEKATGEVPRGSVRFARIWFQSG
jgi:hypothetical protein